MTLDDLKWTDSRGLYMVRVALISERVRVAECTGSIHGTYYEVQKRRPSGWAAAKRTHTLNAALDAALALETDFQRLDAQSPAERDAELVIVAVPSRTSRAAARWWRSLSERERGKMLEQLYGEHN